MTYDLIRILQIYEGSDGDATRELFGALADRGPAGTIGLYLFRAHKNSARAKKYRGGNGRGSYRSQAYDRKVWSIAKLAEGLAHHAESLGIRWGWKHDPRQPVHDWILYVDLPAGQVSYHTSPRGVGPDYPGAWDEVRGMGPDRIARYCRSVLIGEAVT